MKQYKIVLLKGDGIGPEIVTQAALVLKKAGEKFGFGVEFDEALLGGSAIDASGNSAAAGNRRQSAKPPIPRSSARSAARSGIALPGENGRKRDFSASAGARPVSPTCARP